MQDIHNKQKIIMVHYELVNFIYIHGNENRLATAAAPNVK